MFYGTPIATVAVGVQIVIESFTTSEVTYAFHGTEMIITSHSPLAERIAKHFKASGINPKVKYKSSIRIPACVFPLVICYI